MTASARQVALTHAKKTPTTSASATAASAQKLQTNSIDVTKFANLVRNARQSGLIEKRWSIIVWRTCDWQRLQRAYPSFDTLSARKSASLCIAGADLDTQHTTVVLCSPKLTKEVLSRTANKHYTKLCGDGTFRLMREGWILLTLGTLSKHHRSAGKTHTAAFRTTFHPWIFAITNKESFDTYSFLFQVAVLLHACLARLMLSVAAHVRIQTNMRPHMQTISHAYPLPTPCLVTCPHTHLPTHLPTYLPCHPPPT